MMMADKNTKQNATVVMKDPKLENKKIFPSPVTNKFVQLIVSILVQQFSQWYRRQPLYFFYSLQSIPLSSFRRHHSYCSFIRHPPHNDREQRRAKRSPRSSSTTEGAEYSQQASTIVTATPAATIAITTPAWYHELVRGVWYLCTGHSNMVFRIIIVSWHHCLSIGKWSRNRHPYPLTSRPDSLSICIISHI